ncbi:MAG: ergothioneine biosynthesis protein EgtC [Microcoleaceae cyanobacterium]
MCRLLGYLGLPIQLDKILSQPEHSLIVQSYQPKEMQEAILNADGFGVGWYHPHKTTQPYLYRNTQPIWNDSNLSSLGRYIESGRILGYVRSATPGQVVTLTNSQPFQSEQLLFTHNGYIDKFRHSLHRPIRERLQDSIYSGIEGTTDSEHLFALFLNELTTADSTLSLVDALRQTLDIVKTLAKKYQVKALVNIMLSDGHQMVASRYAVDGLAPSLYWLKDDPQFPESVMIASEPLFDADWQTCPEQTIIHVGEDRDLHLEKLA